jgi:hypothetical protein
VPLLTVAEVEEPDLIGKQIAKAPAEATTSVSAS